MIKKQTNIKSAHFDSLYYVSYPKRFEEIQVGLEVSLGLVQPASWRPADDVLGESRHPFVLDGHKVLKCGGAAHISQMDAKTFDQHLKHEEHQ